MARFYNLLLLVVMVLKTDAPLTWHAYASKCARVVQAASVILTRMTFAFVDICFASRSSKAL